MELNKIFGIEQYEEAYKFAKENKYFIEEVSSIDNKRMFKIVEKLAYSDEDVIDILRQQRDIECFSVVNRGELWYETLTVEMYLELKQWYQQWLDVTITKAVPKKPSWIN